MKSKDARKPRAVSKRISGWDDAIFVPADLVRDVRDLADDYEGKKKLTLRTFTVVAPVPRFSPAEIVERASEPSLIWNRTPKASGRGVEN